MPLPEKTDSEQTVAQRILAQFDPEEVAIWREIREENQEKFEETGDFSLLAGLQQVGVTADAVQEVIDIGRQMLRQNMLDKARDYFAGVVQLEPYNWQAHQLLGVVLQKKGYFGLAEIEYSLAEALNSTDGITKLYRGECLLHLGHKETGLEKLNQGLEIVRRDPQLSVFAKRAEQVIAKQSLSPEK